ncbi:MAG: hypothetical protein QF790_06620 [Gammaproteobacteria bacterium]|jgi:hypothetical protein|nr:hypothetical protein [Gammaproteobacteria bacterium]MDP6616821.1 hypothetical protein [Gammaproteobacteria bacterium]
MKFILLVIGISVLAACTSPTSVTQLGPNTYQATPGTDTWDHTRQTVGDTPTKVCAKIGKKSLVTNISGNGAVVFRCLDENDPEYRDIDYEIAPNVRIETEDN